MGCSRATRRRFWLWLIHVSAFTIWLYRGTLMLNLYRNMNHFSNRNLTYTKIQSLALSIRMQPCCLPAELLM